MTHVYEPRSWLASVVVRALRHTPASRLLARWGGAVGVVAVLGGCTWAGSSADGVRTPLRASAPGVASLSVSPPPLTALPAPSPGERAGSAVELSVTSGVQRRLLRVGAHTLGHSRLFYGGIQLLVYTMDRATGMRYAAGYLRVGPRGASGGIGRVGREGGWARGARYELFTRSADGKWTMRVEGDYGPPASQLRRCAPGLPRDVRRLWQVAPGACEPDP